MFAKSDLCTQDDKLTSRDPTRQKIHGHTRHNYRTII